MVWRGAGRSTRMRPRGGSPRVASGSCRPDSVVWRVQSLVRTATQHLRPFTIKPLDRHQFQRGRGAGERGAGAWERVRMSRARFSGLVKDSEVAIWFSKGGGQAPWLEALGAAFGGDGFAFAVVKLPGN